MPAGAKAETRRSSRRELSPLCPQSAQSSGSSPPALAAQCRLSSQPTLGPHTPHCWDLLPFSKIFFLGNPKVVLAELTLFWYLFESRVTHEHAGCCIRGSWELSLSVCVWICRVVCLLSLLSCRIFMDGWRFFPGRLTYTLQLELCFWLQQDRILLAVPSSLYVTQCLLHSPCMFYLRVLAPNPVHGLRQWMLGYIFNFSSWVLFLPVVVHVKMCSG